MKNKIDNVYEITKELLGPISPQGESNFDEIAYRNLKHACSVVGCLLDDIIDVSDNVNRHEASIHKCGKHAQRFIRSIKQQLADVHTETVQEFEYEHLFRSDVDEPCPIDGWVPIATDRIKHPEHIEEYIANGTLRRIIR